MKSKEHERLTLLPSSTSLTCSRGKPDTPLVMDTTSSPSRPPTAGGDHWSSSCLLSHAHSHQRSGFIAGRLGKNEGAALEAEGRRIRMPNTRTLRLCCARCHLHHHHHRLCCHGGKQCQKCCSFYKVCIHTPLQIVTTASPEMHKPRNLDL